MDPVVFCYAHRVLGLEEVYGQTLFQFEPLNMTRTEY